MPGYDIDISEEDVARNRRNQVNEADFSYSTGFGDSYDVIVTFLRDLGGTTGDRQYIVSHIDFRDESPFSRESERADDNVTLDYDESSQEAEDFARSILESLE
ncbi:MAG: hypothetical protein ABEJ99_00880 [Candidatus Nanohaloarchaea archaeon]